MHICLRCPQCLASQQQSRPEAEQDVGGQPASSAADVAPMLQQPESQMLSISPAQPA